MLYVLTIRGMLLSDRVKHILKQVGQLIKLCSLFPCRPGSEELVNQVIALLSHTKDRIELLRVELFFFAV